MNTDRSCKGCKFLYRREDGYSSWTITGSTVSCALGKNPNLPDDKPESWNPEFLESDVWNATQDARCSAYVAGPHVLIDINGEDLPIKPDPAQGIDQEQADAINASEGAS